MKEFMVKNNALHPQNATKILAEFAVDIRYEQIPDEVIARMKMSLLDSIGCCLYGVTLPWTRAVQSMIEDEKAAPVASVFGAQQKTSVAGAVLINGTAGHAFELDDIHKESIVHPGSIAIPVLIALSELNGHTSGKKLLTAMTVGYEIGTRIGNAATIDLFFKGFHPQGTSGVFVAAAVAGKMLDLDKRLMQHCLGIVGSQAGGLMAAQEGATVKRFHSGRAAQSGIYSAMLAKKGLTGIDDALEAGYGGFLSTYSGKPNAQKLTDDLGIVWEASKVGYKLHACVTSIHTALDAFNELIIEHALKPEDIARVDVGLSPMTYTHCAWEYKGQSVTAAQMNLFYGMAVIAFYGVAFVKEYSEQLIRAPHLIKFIERIHAYVDNEINEMGAAYRHASIVRVTTLDNQLFERQIFHRHGSPENPSTYENVKHKFRNVAAVCLNPIDMERVIQIIESIENLDRLDELISILAKPSYTP